MNLFQRKKTILIVEDEADIAEGLKARLMLESFHVELAVNGQDGVTAARKIKPDLIIMDVMMPLINGLDACSALKAGDDTKQIPILMLTALPHMKDVENAFEVGADDFLNKPYSNERLLKKIETLLGEETMSADGVAAFDVLLGSPADTQIGPLAESIAAFQKVPFQDAAHAARTAWGFVGKNLSEADAKNLVTIMQSKGLAAHVVKSSEIAPLPAIQEVKALEFDGPTLKLTLMSGSMETLASPNLLAIAALALPMRSVSKEKITEGRTNVEKLVNVGLLLSGIPISVGKKKRVIEKTTVKEDLLFYVDLLANAPARRFRIDAQRLNYAFLKEKMLHSTLQNFKMLLKDLTQWAPKAHLNKGTLFFNKSLILTQTGYESFAHLEKETLWLSALPR